MLHGPLFDRREAKVFKRGYEIVGRYEFDGIQYLKCRWWDGSEFSIME